MEVGELMRAARVAAGVSLAEMARRTAYSKPYLGMLETRRKRVRPEHVQAYERALGASIDPLAAAATAPRMLDAAALDDLATILAATRRLEDRVGAAVVLPAARGMSAMSTELAREARGAMAAPTLAVASEVAQYRGWLEHVVGGRLAARAALERAITLGSESGDPDVLSNALNFLAFVAVEGDGDAGVPEAAAATDAALRIRRANPQSRTYHHYQRARLHARAGEPVQARRMLAVADRMAQALPDDPPASGYWFTPGYWALQRGRVLALLGEREAAWAEIRAGVAALPDDQRDTEWMASWVAVAAGEVEPYG